MRIKCPFPGPSICTHDSYISNFYIVKYNLIEIRSTHVYYNVVYYIYSDLHEWIIGSDLTSD